MVSEDVGVADTGPVATDTQPAVEDGSPIVPTIGRIVRYRLRSQDVAQINDRRESCNGPGNAVNMGDAFPMVIVAVWGNSPDSYVNGQVLLDGPDTHWATSVRAGTDAPGTFSWPVR